MVEVELPAEIFDVQVNIPLIHQVVVAQQAAARQGTHATKTRGDVRGGGKKPYKQKGTGRARQGSIRAPHHTGGGIVFGPKPRDYTQKIPKMIKRLAIRSALSAKVRDNELKVIDELAPETPKTKEMVAMLRALSFERSPLIVTGASNRAVFLAGRNIEGAKVLPATHINTEDILVHHGVVMTVDAVRQAEALWGGERVTQRRAPVPAVATATVEG